MPGVNLHTATRSGPAPDAVPPAGRYFVVGQFERGPTGRASVISSFGDLVGLYGDRVSYSAAYDDLRTYFEEGGSDAVVARVVGPAATKGTLSLMDRAATPVATLRVDALGAGASSANITVLVRNGSNAGTYAMVISGPVSSGIVETYDNLVTPADATYKINATSKLVTATDLGSASVSPTNQPKAIAATPLSAGNDDRGTITAATMYGALALFGPDLGVGAVSIPGYPSSTVGTQLIAHAKTTRRVALLATAIGTDQAGALAAADSLIGTDGAEFAGLFYPWVRIPLGGGATKLISPEGYVAACRARAILEDGPWRAPGGEVAAARFVVGVEQELTRANGDLLDEGHVSAIRTIVDTTRLYGWRSLSTDADNYALLTFRDVLNVVATEATRRLERFVFRPIDSGGKLYAAVAAELVGILEPYRVAGGLYERVIAGETVDPGYSVDVGDAINTDASVAAGRVNAVIALRVSPVGSLIDLTIVKVGLTATV